MDVYVFYLCGENEEKKNASARAPYYLRERKQTVNIHVNEIKSKREKKNEVMRPTHASKD